MGQHSDMLLKSRSLQLNNLSPILTSAQTKNSPWLTQLNPTSSRVKQGIHQASSTRQPSPGIYSAQHRCWNRARPRKSQIQDFPRQSTPYTCSSRCTWGRTLTLQINRNPAIWIMEFKHTSMAQMSSIHRQVWVVATMQLRVIQLKQQPWTTRYPGWGMNSGQSRKENLARDPDMKTDHSRIKWGTLNSGRPSCLTCQDPSPRFQIMN